MIRSGMKAEAGMYRTAAMIGSKNACTKRKEERVVEICEAKRRRDSRVCAERPDAENDPEARDPQRDGKSSRNRLLRREVAGVPARSPGARPPAPHGRRGGLRGSLGVT